MKIFIVATKMPALSLRNSYCLSIHCPLTAWYVIHSYVIWYVITRYVMWFVVRSYSIKLCCISLEISACSNCRWVFISLM